MSNATRTCIDEADLVKAAREGSFDAFDALVGKYRSGALSIARQIVRSEELAQDAVQDSFFAAYKALPQLSDTGSFPQWLGAIVRHRSRRIASGALRLTVPLDDLILAHVPSIAVQVESRLRNEAIRGRVAILSDELRVAVELYYFDGWQVATIADFLGIPVTTVKWRLHAARNQLRKGISQDWEDIDESGK
ncbi:MAG: sigma-70 family RNA polymerase sigma factor [Fimbriimonas sp.]|nr:sigma-70 family RNA polymerase sigma factor [Fimbriimonas sp.]